MAGAHDPTTSTPGSLSSSGGGDSNETSDFECNICFDLARDPVITLCGHLYCWPCLYMWLRGHSQASDCPVCKALVVEEKVIPLYGRGKSPVDPRSKPIPGVEIPNRPSGQRPETAPQPADPTNLANVLMGFMGGFVPIASATFNNFGMAANFGGVFSPFFSVQYGFSNSRGYGGSRGYHQNGYPGPFHDGERRTNRERAQAMQADDENLTKILLVIFILVVLTFLTM